jgi:RND family efflux transporter MFP subunit
MNANEANVRQLEAMQSFMQITAQFDGVVTARNTDIGALISAGSSAGQELFEVSDLHEVRIYVQVPQALSAELRPGLKATFEMPQHPGRKFDATLVSTSSAVNVTSHSMLIAAAGRNADGKLFGGTCCKVTFQIPSDPNMVRVPATALMPVNRGAQVAVLGDGNKVVLKSVQLGRDFGDSVEVTAGLAPQHRVIDSPPETLQAGDAVQLGRAAAIKCGTGRAVGFANGPSCAGTMSSHSITDASFLGRPQRCKCGKGGEEDYTLRAGVTSGAVPTLRGGTVCR